MVFGKKAKWYLSITFAIALALGTAFTLAHRARAQTEMIPLEELEQADQAEAAESALRVGTYQPQIVFEQHPGHAELMKAIQSAQEQMQGGDREQAMQRQQELAQIQDRIIGQFQQDVEKALPEVAEEVNVKVVAVEVAYSDDDVETVDVTSELGRAVSDDEEPDQMQEFPGLPAE